MQLSEKASPFLLLARVFALIALYAIPVSPAVVNIASGIFALFALCAPEVRHNWRQLFADRVILSTLLLIAMMLVSLLWTSANRADALASLGKYHKLLCLPFLLLTFRDCRTTAWAKAALGGLVAVLTFTLLLSCTNYFGLTAVGRWYAPTDLQRAWVFKDHISAGLMNALLFFLALRFGDRAHSRLAKAAFYVLAFVSIVNVMLMLQGRTGQVVAIFYMIGYVVMRIAHMRTTKPYVRWATGVVLLAICASVVVVSLRSHDSRLAGTDAELRLTETKNAPTSTGIRFVFIERSLALIEERPVFGHGVGTVHDEFDAFARNQTGVLAVTSNNPHNEYLLMSIQLGLVGLALFINWLVQISLAARSLTGSSRTVVVSYLFAFVIGCLANSLLLNFTEGNLFIFLVGIFLRQQSQQSYAGERVTAR